MAHETLATRRRLLDFVTRELEPSRVPDSSASNPERQLREAELERALKSAVAGLGPEDRLLLKLRFEDEQPASRIARVLQFPSVFHVYRRLKQVLAFLRRQLERDGVYDPNP